IPIEDGSTYIVQKGDTLWNIAKKNNISVNELKEINNLDSNTISIGQILKIRKF
ncbi:MAG: LysM peptidoglycan-binding domain-containing protein, partial [Bacilli bacterium]|nr:LysM peptidoglycan-binding domain-containing protein [Bacilli bacterium]